MLFISLHMASHQRVFTFSSSCICLLHWLVEIDAKIMHSKPIHWLNISNDAVAIRQHMPDPPCKYWVPCNTELYHIFNHLHRVWVIHILEGHYHFVLPSFHWTSNSTPFVVSLWYFVPVRIVMNGSCYFTSVPSYLWSKISWNRTKHWIWLSQPSPRGSWFLSGAKE